MKTDALTINSTLMKILSNKIVLTIGFALLTAVCAQITIPVKPVPFTLQVFAVILAGAFLGAQGGAYSMILYLAMGAVGLPVFAVMPEAGIGFARLIGPTGGYLLAFPIGAFLTGLIIENYKNYFAVVLAMFAGTLIITVIGALYLNVVYLNNFSESVKVGLAVFSLWSVIKVLAASSIYFGIKKFSK